MQNQQQPTTNPAKTSCRLPSVRMARSPPGQVQMRLAESHIAYVVDTVRFALAYAGIGTSRENFYSWQNNI